MQLSGRGHDRARHAAQPRAGNSGAFPRYRLSLCGDVRISRQDGERLEAESCESCREKDGGAAGSGIRDFESDGSGAMLPSAKSRAADGWASKLRSLVHGPAAGAIADTKEFENRGAPRIAERQSGLESESAGGVDVGSGLGV